MGVSVRLFEVEKSGFPVAADGGLVGYGLGVDLGTSYTAVAIGRNGRTRIVPLSDDPISGSSLIAVRPAGSVLVREVDETVPVVLGGRPYPQIGRAHV